MTENSVDIPIAITIDDHGDIVHFFAHGHLLKASFIIAIKRYLLKRMTEEEAFYWEPDRIASLDQWEFRHSKAMLIPGTPNSRFKELALKKKMSASFLCTILEEAF